MFKKLLIGALALLVIGAIGVSAYNNVAASTGDTAQAAAIASQAGWGNAGAVNNDSQAQSGNRQGGNGNGSQAGAVVQNATAQDAAILGVTDLGTGSQSGAGQGGARRRGGSQGNTNGTGIPDPQNGFAELVTVSGTVEAFNPPNLTLVRDDGQQIPVEIGNLNYAADLNLAITVGERLTITGSWDSQGGFAASQVTVASSGVTYALRDEYGRPLWRGGQH